MTVLVLTVGQASQNINIYLYFNEHYVTRSTSDMSHSTPFDNSLDTSFQVKNKAESHRLKT